MFLKSDIFQKMMVVDNDYHSAKEKREVIIGKLEDWNHLNNNINFLNIDYMKKEVFEQKISSIPYRITEIENFSQNIQKFNTNLKKKLSKNNFNRPLQKNIALMKKKLFDLNISPNKNKLSNKNNKISCEKTKAIKSHNISRKISNYVTEGLVDKKNLPNLEQNQSKSRDSKIKSYTLSYKPLSFRHNLFTKILSSRNSLEYSKEEKCNTDRNKVISKSNLPNMLQGIFRNETKKNIMFKKEEESISENGNLLLNSEKSRESNEVMKNNIFKIKDKYYNMLKTSNIYKSLAKKKK